MFNHLLSALASTGALKLLAGLLAGLAVVLVIRAIQVWNWRQVFGYNVYTAHQRQRRLMRGAAALLLLLGVVGSLAVGRWWMQALASRLPPAPTPAGDLPREARLIIPRMGIVVPVIEAPIVGNQWDISQLTGEVAHLGGTVYPGDAGNAVLAGHITIPNAGWGPFRELETLEAGDLVFIERGGRQFRYEVFQKQIVAPEAVNVVFPTDDTRLTLLTCTGWNEESDTYASRVVVVARLVSSESIN